MRALEIRKTDFGSDQIQLSFLFCIIIILCDTLLDTKLFTVTGL